MSELQYVEHNGERFSIGDTFRRVSKSMGFPSGTEISIKKIYKNGTIELDHKEPGDPKPWTTDVYFLSDPFYYERISPDQAFLSNLYKEESL